jgi:S-formylglutathione hydrolase FrmB
MRDGQVSRLAIWRRRLVAIAAIVLAGVAAWRIVVSVLEPDKRGARVEHLTIDSRAVGQSLPTTVVVPAGDGGGARPLLVFLHGRGGDQNSELNDQFYAALADLGRRAPVVAFPYGGESSYWHDRDGGDWDRYVVREVIPAVARETNADSHRVAVGGISMGGFGAFDLVLHHPDRFCAAGGHGPAIWQTGAETPEGAFDDAEDFDRNDLVGTATNDPATFGNQPLWIDAGAEDPFQPGDRAFAGALENAGDDVTAKLTRPGGHDGDYWNSHWGEYLRFYANALAKC